MLWTSSVGGAAPIGSKFNDGKFSLGGCAFEGYSGQVVSGSSKWNVISLVATEDCQLENADLMDPIICE